MEGRVSVQLKKAQSLLHSSYILIIIFFIINISIISLATLNISRDRNQKINTYYIHYPIKTITFDGINTNNEWNNIQYALVENILARNTSNPKETINLSIQMKMCHNDTDLILFIILSSRDINNGLLLDNFLLGSYDLKLRFTFPEFGLLSTQPFLRLTIYESHWIDSIMGWSKKGVRLIDEIRFNSDWGPGADSDLGILYAMILDNCIGIEIQLNKENVIHILGNSYPSSIPISLETLKKMMFNKILYNFSTIKTWKPSKFDDELFSQFHISEYCYNFDLVLQGPSKVYTPSKKEAIIPLTILNWKLTSINVTILIECDLYITYINISSYDLDNASLYNLNLKFRDQNQLSHICLLTIDPDNYFNEINENNNNLAVTVIIDLPKIIVWPDNALTIEPITFQGITIFNELFFDFGDGNNSNWINDKSIKHLYHKMGNYIAKLKVRDEYGLTSNWCYINLTINNRPPVIESSSLFFIYLTNEPIYFDISVYDIDGFITKIYWNFGNGNINDMPNPVHSYSKAGIYTVHFTTWDDDGASNSTEFKIYVMNRGPLADFNMSLTTATILDDIAFTPEAFDMDGAISRYFWDFGDGSTSDEPNPTHRYRTKGTFWPTLYVVDDDSAASNIARKQIIVENIPPQGAINASSTSPLTLEKINLTASGSDADGTVKLYIWDFSDGTTAVGENVSHEYRDDGTYEVKLRVIDDDFDENVTNITINVRNRGPVIGLKYEQKLMADERAFLDASGSFDLDGCVVSVSWLIENRTIHGTVINYTFTKPGKYLVRVAVRDDDGALAEKSFEITVQAVRISRETFLFWMWAVVILATVALTIAWKRRTTR